MMVFVGAECDRCVEPTPATKTVTCWYGCEHEQCDGCAEQTTLEAKDQDKHVHCQATTVFWPEDEACDAVCILADGHEPTNVHRDEILGEWTDD